MKQYKNSRNARKEDNSIKQSKYRKTKWNKKNIGKMLTFLVSGSSKTI